MPMPQSAAVLCGIRAPAGVLTRKPPTSGSRHVPARRRHPRGHHKTRSCRQFGRCRLARYRCRVRTLKTFDHRIERPRSSCEKLGACTSDPRPKAPANSSTVDPLTIPFAMLDSQTSRQVPAGRIVVRTSSPSSRCARQLGGQVQQSGHEEVISGRTHGGRRRGYTRPIGSRGSSREENMMPTAREIMTADATCVGERETLAVAAQKMAQLDVGSLPICGENNRLKGMVTDRDIVIKAVAEGPQPRRRHRRGAGRGQAGHHRCRRRRRRDPADHERTGAAAAGDRRSRPGRDGRVGRRGPGAVRPPRR